MIVVAARALLHVRGGRARRLLLSSGAPAPVRDGEPGGFTPGFTPVEIGVLPAALAVVVV